MSIHGYVGNVITANPTAPTVSVATGVWTTEQQFQAVAAGNWPMALTQISRSLRFNSADSAYLNRTPASAGNRRTWTYSFWVKRAKLSRQMFFGVYTSSTDTAVIEIESDQIYWYDYLTSSYRYELRTTQVLRDPSAWYHIMCVLDTTQATSSNRNKIYINGSLVTALTTATYPTQNLDGKFNTAVQHSIGTEGSNLRLFLDAYQTETYFIDGQALTPSSFGFNSSDTGVWSPKQYIGSYGTNGFYLNFSDNSGTTSTTLGKDSSGNGNNWTPNNFSVTAGVGNDSMVDSPTLYGTNTGVGGEVRGNYCTWNPIAAKGANTSITNGNLYASASSNSYGVAANFVISSGKWYWEITIDSGSSTANGNYYGVGDANTKMLQMTDEYNSPYTSGYIAVFYSGGEGKIIKGVNGTMTNLQTGLATTASSDVLGFALDCDASPATLSVYRNNSLLGSAQSLSGIGSGIWVPFVGAHNAVDTNANFGQRAFAYTAPSGFKALCTTNLPTPTIGATSTTLANDYFDVTLYTGTDATQTITNSGLMQPDLVWVKSRNGAYNHYLYDSIRGATNALRSSTTGAESQAGDSTLTTTTNGFTVTGTGLGVNSNGTTIVGWQWNAGGSTVTNTSGTISAQVRANTTSGFSIVTYTGTGSNATVGHGLGVAPSMVIVKKRSASENWVVYHTSVGATKYLTLNLTDAETTSATRWNNTAPTSTVFSIGTSGNVNDNTGTYVAYCFASVAGYSAFGSYTGNGSADGPFVYLGFRPEFVMIKNATTAGTSWEMFDNARETFNLMDLELLANSSNAEGTYTYGDFVSNGFKLRSTNNGVNQSSATLIYMAFAENPFKYALAR